MPKIVISYRRDDSAGITGRIFDRLVAHYGRHSIFMDIDIPFGPDFRARIDEALSECQILIPVIGRRWIGPQRRDPPRISSQDDPVRIEIEAALERNIHILPVLVDGASMPNASILPQSLQPFAYRNAATVDTGRDFHAHIERLFRAIDALEPEKKGIRSKWQLPKAFVLVATTAALLALLFLGKDHLLNSIQAVIEQRNQSALLTAANNDDAQWSAARTTGDVSAYENYLKVWPEGRHAAEARAAIDEIRKDDAEWQIARNANQGGAYEIYLTAWPWGRHATEARKAADNIREDDEAWRTAVSQAQAEAYGAYLKAWPQGRHASEARAAIDDIRKDDAGWQTAQKTDQIDSYEAYLKARPDGRHAADARAAVDGIRDDDASWRVAHNAARVDAYQSYLNVRPQGRHASEARAALDDIPKDNVEWEVARKANEIQGYEAYLKARPQGRYAAAARASIGNIRRDDAEWDAVQKSGQVDAYVSYLMNRIGSPDGRHAAKARAAIADINANDDAEWNIARQSGQLESYDAYLNARPQGRHAAEARTAISNLRRTENLAKIAVAPPATPPQAQTQRPVVPFLGKWALVISIRPSSDCIKVTPFTVSERTITTPQGVLALEEITRDGDRWILQGHDIKTGEQWPRVIYKDITPTSMTIQPIGSGTICKVRRVAM